MRLNPVWNWVHLVLGLAALLHAEANKASCDHERARQSREVIQQVSTLTPLFDAIAMVE